MLIPSFLETTAAIHKKKTALVTEKGRFSYLEIDELANKVANTLLDSKIQPGDRVIVYMENGLEAVAGIFGILKAGGVFVIINPRTRLKKLNYLLGNCSASALITSSETLPDTEGISDDIKTLQTIITSKPGCETNAYSSGKNIVFWQDIVTSAQNDAPQRRGAPTDLAALIYTSGSTDHPKGVMLSHLNMVSAANSIIQYLENTENDIVLNVHPLSFDYGLYQVLMGFKFGGTVVLRKNYGYPYSIIKCLQEEKITGFPIVPTVAALLGDMNNAAAMTFPHLRYITNTADTLQASHIATLRNIFPNAKIFSMYGLTECKRVAYLPPEKLAEKPSSVGIPMPNVEVCIVDEAGNEVGPHVEGELVVCGQNVMQGYWNNPEETAKRLKPLKGSGRMALFTNDIFTMDEDGYLYFKRRTNQMLKVKGEAVSPREIENVIIGFPGVKEVIVIGVPCKVFGHKILAIIVPSDKQQLTSREIMQYCIKHLDNNLLPHMIEFRKNLPRNDNGKIQR